MSEPTERKRAAHLYGLRAETLAALYLRGKLYRILAQRYRIKGGEIDIVAAKGDVVAFVEVKARADMDSALVAITQQKRRRLSRAAAHWLARNPGAMTCTLRADAVFIAPGSWPRHVEAAMELELG